MLPLSSSPASSITQQDLRLPFLPEAPFASLCQLNVANPLSRLPMASAQVVCCALSVGGTANAIHAEVDIVADIMSGYASDA